MSEITPESVVAEFFGAEGTHYDDSGNGWFHVIEPHGNVLAITITPSDEDGFETDKPVHFRAVVVEGETVPIVLQRPALEQDWNHSPTDVRSWVSPDYFVCFQTWRTDVAYLTPREARREAARLAALADEADALAAKEIGQRLAEASQAVQNGGTS